MRDYIKKIPKYLLLDVETLYAKGEFWHTGKQRISHQQITQESCLLSWAAKWLYDSEVFGDVLTTDESTGRDDKRIAESLWKMFDDADVIIGHNVRSFDIRFSNGRFFRNGLKPPSPYQTIDTLREYEKTMRILSYKLDYISFLINNQRKLHTDYELWQRCDKGDNEALQYMFVYNKKDVLLLEEAYLEIRPWIKSHPNYAIFSESTISCCIYCGSDQLDDGGIYVTPAGRFHCRRCKECGGISRERYSDITRQERNNLMIGVAR